MAFSNSIAIYKQIYLRNKFNNLLAKGKGLKVGIHLKNYRGNKNIFKSILVVFMGVLLLQVVSAQGVTVTSVSTPSVITKDTDSSNIEWLINTPLDGGDPNKGPVRGTAQFTSIDLKQWAKDIGYNIDSCLDSGKFRSEVQKDLSDATATGGQGTPYFIINGVPVSGAQPFSVFQQIIESELA